MKSASASRTFWRDERGSTMVEFSLVAFLFVLILLGIGEFGIATWAKNSVAHAAREGARWAIVRGQNSGQSATAGQVSAYVQSQSALKGIAVTTVWPIDHKEGSPVVVTVTYPYKRVGLMIGDKTLTSTSRMVIVY